MNSWLAPAPVYTSTSRAPTFRALPAATWTRTVTSRFLLTAWLRARASRPATRWVSVRTLLLSIKLAKDGAPTATRIATMATAIISSTRVKPRMRRRVACVTGCVGFCPSALAICFSRWLPCVGLFVNGFIARFGLPVLFAVVAFCCRCFLLSCAFRCRCLAMCFLLSFDGIVMASKQPSYSINRHTLPSLGPPNGQNF